MSKFNKLLPALALSVALSPLAANAFSRHADVQSAGYSAGRAVTSQVAANSKGRPAEFAPACDAVAANSKGRPAEFAPAQNNQLAANSKGRPAEFAPASANQVAANSKGRPGEFQLADNSKGRPGEFSAPQSETPLG